MLKYDTLGAKLPKCLKRLLEANLLKWVSPPAKLLKSLISGLSAAYQR